MWWLNSDPAYRINGAASQSFSSWHSGGTGFLFADGSVRFFDSSIDGYLLECLAARNDGEVTGGS